MENNILYFEIEVTGDALNDGVKPIFNEAGTKLLGGFVLKRGDTISCFIAATEKPYSLFFTSEQPFYLTPKTGSDGKIDSAVVSECPISVNSVKINAYKVGSA